MGAKQNVRDAVRALDRVIRTDRSTVGAAEKPRQLPLVAVAAIYAALETVIVIAISAATGAIYYRLAFEIPAPLHLHLQLGVLIAFLVVAASLLQGSYRPDEIHAIAQQPDKLALSIVFGLLGLIVLLFAAKRSIDYSRSVIFISGGLNFLVLLVARLMASRYFQVLVRHGRVRLPNLLLVGHASLIVQFVTQRRAQKTHFIVASHEISARPGDARFDEEVADARRLAQSLEAESVVLCLPWNDGKIIQAYVAQLAELPSALYLNDDPHLREIATWSGASDPGSLGHIIVRRPLSTTQLALKRAFDLAAAGVGVVLISPLLVLIAALIKLDSRGPVLFKQQRYGYNRIPFPVYKFRTMTAQSSNESFRQATRNDPRVTRVGRILRRLSLDELPQLFNVLSGTMSLVGPRPHPVELDEQFAPLIAHYTTRHKVKPGITGLAQVKGHRGETGSTARMHDRISHDVFYLNHWSFWLDIKILLLTIGSLATQRNAV